MSVKWMTQMGYLLGGAAVIALAFSSGGYYPATWGWGLLVALAVAFVVLICTRRIDLSRDEWWMLLALASFVGWIAVTAATQSGAATLAVPELERAGLYLAIVWAALVLPRRSARTLPGGVLAGIVVTCVYGLADYLFRKSGEVPDPNEGRHLFEPVGYANGFGMLLGIGVVLALGFAVSSRTVLRALCIASLVPLVTALALTGSRGAVIATAIGFAVTIALHPDRRSLATTAWIALPLPIVSAGIAIGSSVSAPGPSIGHDVHAAHYVAIAIVALTGASFAIAWQSIRSGWGGGWSHGALLAGGAAGLSGVLGDRPKYWHAAWLDVIHHPLLGSGAGSFEVAWLRYRTVESSVLDAHNLYLETLAELGPVGLVLLVAALAIPLRAGLTSEPSAQAAAVCGAYAAFLAHAAIDWDWELPVVTVAALLCGVALLKLRPPAATQSRAVIVGGLAASAVAGVLAATALAGNLAIHRAVEHLQSGSWADAARAAHDAARWQPWSAEPYDVLGQAELARGHRVAAAAAFREALRRDDRRWQTWYELGRISAGAERQVAFEHILELNPFAVRVSRP